MFFPDGGQQENEIDSWGLQRTTNFTITQETFGNANRHFHHVFYSPLPCFVSQ